MPLACRVHWSWVDRTGDTVKEPLTEAASPTCNWSVVCWRPDSKMFWQHLKCSRTSTKTCRTWTSSEIFLCFFLLSQLREPERLGTAFSWPASRLASAKTSSGYDTSLMVDRQYSLSICRTQSLEEKYELGRVGETYLGWTDGRAQHWHFFLMLTRKGRGLRERWDKILRCRHSEIHCTHYDARRRVKGWVFPKTLEVRAGRLSGSFKLRGHRTVQTR